MNTAPSNAHADPGFLDWITRLVRSHRRELVARARRMGLDGEDALDCVQDAFASFMELPEARTVARDSDEAIKLLSVVLRHIVLNRRRRLRRRAGLLDAAAEQLAPPPEPPVDRALAELEELARARGCILRMRSLQRRVIELCLLEDRPGEDVAAALGISAGYARVLLHRAREHLRSCDFAQETPVPWPT